MPCGRTCAMKQANTRYRQLCTLAGCWLVRMHQCDGHQQTSEHLQGSAKRHPLASVTGCRRLHTITVYMSNRATQFIVSGLMPVVKGPEAAISASQSCESHRLFEDPGHCAAHAVPTCWRSTDSEDHKLAAWTKQGLKLACDVCHKTGTLAVVVNEATKSVLKGGTR